MPLCFLISVGASSIQWNAKLASATKSRQANASMSLWTPRCFIDTEVEVDLNNNVLTVCSTGKKYNLKSLGDVSQVFAMTPPLLRLLGKASSGRRGHFCICQKGGLNQDRMNCPCHRVGPVRFPAVNYKYNDIKSIGLKSITPSGLSAQHRMSDKSEKQVSNQYRFLNTDGNIINAVQTTLGPCDPFGFARHTPIAQQQLIQVPFFAPEMPNVDLTSSQYVKIQYLTPGNQLVWGIFTPCQPQDAKQGQTTTTLISFVLREGPYPVQPGSYVLSTVHPGRPPPVFGSPGPQSGILQTAPCHMPLTVSVASFKAMHLYIPGSQVGSPKSPGNCRAVFARGRDPLW